MELQIYECVSMERKGEERRMFVHVSMQHGGGRNH
jgi:hypothetical protein